MPSLTVEVTSDAPILNQYSVKASTYASAITFSLEMGYIYEELRLPSVRTAFELTGAAELHRSLTECIVV